MFTPRSFFLKRHTRHVLICKWSLPIFAFLLTSLMIVWPTLFVEQAEQFALAVPTDKKMIGTDVDMEQVRFLSVDEKKQPLTVTAPKILETDSDNQVVTLYEPKAIYKMQSGVVLTSQTIDGLFYQQENKIFFEKDIVTTTDTGYKALSKKVTCFNQKGLIQSNTKVTISGPDGKLKADGFSIYNKGNNLDFDGKTDTTVFSDEGNIRIQSQNGLKIKQNDRTITALKNVVVTQNGRKITADKMVLHYDNNNKIHKIEAIQNVVAESENNKITGKYGVYIPSKSLIEMNENVRLYQGDSHIDGSVATLNLATGESSLTPLSENNGRIKGKLIPAELKGK